MSHPFNAFSSSGISSAALSAALAAKLDKAGGTMTGALAITAGSLTTSPLSVSQTWNNAGVTCRGLELAVTDTNSASGSTLIRALGGAGGATEKFLVTKDARVCAEVGGAFPQFTGIGNTGTGVRVASDRVDFWLSSSVLATINSNGLSLDNGILVLGGLSDMIVRRAAAASLQLGSNHATTGTTQTIKSHNVTTGTGADLVLTGGTGSVNGGMVKLSNASGDVRMSVGDDGIGFFSSAPQPQITTAISGAVFSAGASSTVTDDSTFDGYTISQIVAGLRTFGLFA